MTANIEQDDRTVESTAAVLARNFKARGVSRDRISPGDLLPYYRAMRSTAKRASGMLDVGLEAPDDTLLTADGVTAVIIETRKHPRLEFVICQVAHQLGLRIQVFHGMGNREFITSTAVRPLIEQGQVHLSELRCRELSAPSYNGLLLHRPFWDALHGRKKILVFQTDTVLCSSADYCIDDFTHFDYVGAHWPRARPIGITIDGGCGGFSLRDWDLTTCCLERFPPEHWPGGEDGYYAFHFDLLGRNVAREADCACFATQTAFLRRSFAAHKIKLLPPVDLARFVEYCPEARGMVNSPDAMWV